MNVYSGTSNSARNRLGTFGAVAVTLGAALISIGSVAAPSARAAVHNLPLPALAPTFAISGTVFRDFDANGARGSREPGEPGITVTAFGPNALVYGPVTTGSDGTWTITGTPAGAALRVEASGLPAWLRPAPMGASDNSLVQFTTTGSIGIDMGVMNPADYCQNQPDMVIPCFLNGNQASTDSVLYRLPFGGATASGATGGTGLAGASTVGTTYGVAYQRSRSRAFAASYVRRHTGQLNDRPGALYVIDNPGTSPVASEWVDLATIGIPMGTVPVNGSAAGQRDLGTKNGAGALSRDPVAGLVGKAGIGDIDMSEDDASLYVVSLAARKLYRIALPADGSAPTSGNVVDLGLGTGACDQPFGLKPLDGKVYVGVTCTASLAAEVRVLDVATGTWASTPALSIDLSNATYGKGCAVVWTSPTAGCNWNTWSDTPDSSWAPTGPATRPTAILSDITFADNGDMIVGFRDRTGDQVGFFNYLYQSGPTTTTEGTSGGDLLRACKTSAGFVLQGGTGCAVKVANNQGPGGGEWYSGEDYPGGHDETAQGALVVRRGSGQLGSVQMDPTDIRAGGVVTYNDDAGTKTAAFQVFLEASGANATSGTGRLGKANGLGDIELLCDMAPIEIGNRVWIDLNGNGVQDPGEPPVTTGVTVNLLDTSDAIIATTVTDGSGIYKFSSKTITGLTPNTANFKVSIDTTQVALGGLKPTTPNATALAGDSTQDDSDSDGVPTGSAVINVLATGRAGSNDHTHDFGFIPRYSLGNRVWLDDGSGGGVANDGLRNGSEPGVDGVSVHLYLADSGGLPGAVAKDMAGVDVAAQTTAGGGYYRFDNLPPGRYVVVVDPTTAVALAGTASSTGVGQQTDPNTDIDNDDNGIDIPLGVGSVLPGGVRSGVIDLLGGEPTTDADGGAIATTEAINDRSNRTVDFGFYAAPPPTTTTTTSTTTTSTTTTSSTTSTTTTTTVAPSSTTSSTTTVAPSSTTPSSTPSSTTTTTSSTTTTTAPLVTTTVAPTTQPPTTLPPTTLPPTPLASTTVAPTTTEVRLPPAIVLVATTEAPTTVPASAAPTTAPSTTSPSTTAPASTLSAPVVSLDPTTTTMALPAAAPAPPARGPSTRPAPRDPNAQVEGVNARAPQAEVGDLAFTGASDNRLAGVGFGLLLLGLLMLGLASSSRVRSRRRDSSG